MPLSDVDRQLLLVQAVGDVDPETGDPVTPTAQGVTGIVFANVGRLWLKYADKAITDPNLRDLYIIREGHDLVIGKLEALVNIATNNGQISVQLASRAKVHQQQRSDITADILRLERQVSQSADFSVGQITTFEPIDPPVPGQMPMSWPYGPNGNDPRYAGSPYWRSRRGSGF